MKATFKESVWVTDPAIVNDLNLDDAESLRQNTYRTLLECDMTESGWLLVGHAEVAITVTASFASLRSAAAQQCDDKIAELQAETEVKLNALRQLKSELLCIEGPSNV